MVDWMIGLNARGEKALNLGINAKCVLFASLLPSINGRHASTFQCNCVPILWLSTAPFVR